MSEQPIGKLVYIYIYTEAWMAPELDPRLDLLQAICNNAYTFLKSACYHVNQNYV